MTRTLAFLLVAAAMVATFGCRDSDQPAPANDRPTQAATKPAASPMRVEIVNGPTQDWITPTITVIGSVLAGVLGGAVVGYFALRVVGKRVADEAKIKARQEQRQLVARLTGLQYHVADLLWGTCNAQIEHYYCQIQYHRAETPERGEVARETMRDWTRASRALAPESTLGLRELFEAASMAPVLFPDAPPKLRSLVIALCRQTAINADPPDKHMQLSHLENWRETESSAIRSKIETKFRQPVQEIVKILEQELAKESSS